MLVKREQRPRRRINIYTRRCYRNRKKRRGGRSLISLRTRTILWRKRVKGLKRLKDSESLNNNYRGKRPCMKRKLG